MVATDAQVRRSRLRHRLASAASREPVLLGLGGVIGVITGVLAFALVQVIAVTRSVVFGTTANTIMIIVAPTIGALVVGLLVTYWVPEVSGGGIVEVIRTITVGGSRFRKRVPLGVLVASGLALGTGASGGREAPIVLGGGAVGSLVGRLFGVDQDRMRTLIAAGAAAGIGASFNAPIGGMMFAIELVLGRLSAKSLQVVVLAAVAGSVTARELVGPAIVFESRVQYGMNDPRELFGYAIVGVLAAGMGLAFLKAEHLGHLAFRRIKIWPPLRIMLGGLGVGLIALAVPEVLGSGHQLPPILGDREPIQSMVDGFTALDGWAAVRLLLVWTIAKFAATMLSVTTGNAVGSLLPALFVGASLGGAIGHAIVALDPASGIEPGAFALVGMAAVFGATARAPLTAILIVFELSGDYGLVLPLMFATGLATFLADRYSSDGIYTDPLRRAGIVIGESDEIDVMQSVTVDEVMTRRPPSVLGSMPLDELRRYFLTSGHHGVAVVDDEHELIGIVTVSDLPDVDVADDTESGVTALDLASIDPLTVTPDTPIYQALHRLAVADVGRLPVIDPDSSPRLVGMLRRTDIIDAYRTALNRGVRVQHRRERTQLRDLAGVHFIELTVNAGSPLDGVELRSANLPTGVTVTSVRRGGDLIVPRGDTTLEAEDEVVALADLQHQVALERLCGGPG